MFTFSLSGSVLCLALLALNSAALPVSQISAIERRVADPCSSKIARTSTTASATAAGCFKELEAHIFAGGKAQVLGSGSGGHLASGVLSSKPEKAGAIVAASLVMRANVVDATKTLWLDDGLKLLITSAETAEKNLEAAEEKVKTAEAAVAKAPNANRKKAANNALKKAQADVKPLSAVNKLMLDNIKPHVPDTSKLYTKAAITAMCVDAMKKSIALPANKNLLKGGTFTVIAPNLGSEVSVRLLEDTVKGRINSCFPVA